MRLHLANLNFGDRYISCLIVDIPFPGIRGTHVVPSQNTLPEHKATCLTEFSVTVAACRTCVTRVTFSSCQILSLILRTARAYYVYLFCSHVYQVYTRMSGSCSEKWAQNTIHLIEPEQNSSWPI
jgi:hypothetical protein